MSAITDSSFARINKESIVRDANTPGAITGQDIAYSPTLTINEKIDSIVVTGGAVSSVNGQVGDVILDASDVGAPAGSGSSTGTNTGDQTSIVGITGTTAQFNTSVSDGDFIFVGDNAQVNSIELDTTPTTPTNTEGVMSWNATDKTVDINHGNGVIQQVGQEQYWIGKNQTGATITNGSIVYANGALGASGIMTIAKYIANGSISGMYVLGVATEDILDGTDGFITTFGKVRGLDTSSYTDGQVLYASISTAGAFQTTAPTFPNIRVPLAFVINSHATNGTIAVRVNNIDESNLVHTSGTESIAGVKTFSDKIIYSVHPTFSADTELVDKKYVDDSITAGGGYTDEQSQDAVGTILVDTATIDFTYNDVTPSIVADVKDSSIGTVKLGLDITAAGKALLDDADAATQRTTLGLGSLATQSGTFSGTSSGTNSGDVTLAGTPSYLTIVGQVITRGLIDLASHVTGLLPFANIANVGTGTVMYRKTAGTGAMESQTLATLKTDLNLTGTNSGDQTSIVGITGTTAQFNTALTDGDFATLAGTETLTNKTLTIPIIGSVKGTVVTDTDGATITFDKNAGGYHRVVLGGNRTLAVSNMAAGDTMVIDLVQDATGSRTVTWFSTIKWVGGTVATLTTAANKIDTFGVLCTSAGNYQVYILGQNL